MNKKKDSIYIFTSIILVIVALVILGGIVSILTQDNKNNLINQTEENLNNQENLNSVENMSEEKMENPIVLFDTNYGEIKIELFLKESPVTAGNFKKLVEEGFYDGIKFHRVIPDFMVQAGDPLSKNDSLQNRWGTGGSEPIEDEFIKGLSNLRGTLSMANAGPNTGSSQFFINVVDNDFLDFDKPPLQSKHPVFGKVIEGMSVVDQISLVRRNSRDVPVDPVIIRKATLIS